MTSPRFRRAFAGIALAALCAGGASAQAQMLGSAPDSENSFSLYGGFRGGGDLIEATTGNQLHADTTPSFALALDLALEPRKQLQLFYSRQKTELNSEFPAAPLRFPLRIEYLHIGGTVFFDEIGNGGYAVAGVGATRLTPDADGLKAEVKPSANIGFGYMLPIVPGLALRMEVRGYATLIDSSGGMFCRDSTGCAVSIKGNAFYQGEGLIGLTARF
jgi:hypothetical protein